MPTAYSLNKITKKVHRHHSVEIIMNTTQRLLIIDMLNISQSVLLHTNLII